MEVWGIAHPVALDSLTRFQAMATGKGGGFSEALKICLTEEGFSFFWVE